jgi:predicted PilT family ATPase
MLLYREAVLLQETTFLYIPNNAVGAIIGTKGTHIRNIIRFSGASVKIAPLEQDKPQDQQTERKVTIVGSPESQWKVLPVFLICFELNRCSCVYVFVLGFIHGTL